MKRTIVTMAASALFASMVLATSASARVRTPNPDNTPPAHYHTTQCIQRPPGQLSWGSIPYCW